MKQYGRAAEEMEELGVMVEQIRREGGSLEGLVNHYVLLALLELVKHQWLA